MKRHVLHGATLCLALGVTSGSLHAASFTFNNAGGDSLWSNATNWSSAASFPSAAGDLAAMSTGAAFTTDFDVDATVGILRNTAGSARVWTITNTGGHTLTLDNTGGSTNGFGTANSEIRATSSGGISLAANLVLSNTDLDVGTTGSNNANAQINLSGTITATNDRTINVRNNRRQTNLLGDIGTSGAGSITIINLTNSTSSAADPNQLNISGNLGSKVVQVTQDTGATSGMVISGANAAFIGNVSVLANSITVTSTGTLGDFNTVSVSAGSLLLQNSAALGASATLEVSGTGLVNLAFSGMDSIAALSLDGGSTFVGSGTWGALGSGAANESAFLSGTGFLNVGVVPEPSAWAAIAGLLALGVVARKRRQAS